jgi:hemolysin-activating ACP:hemolysin acyltransferase
VALLLIVTKNRDNYPIYQFITPFISKFKSNSFKYFYEALQQPQRQCDWEIFINDAVSEAESGNNYLTEM